MEERKIDQIKFKKIKAKELSAGDIFYYRPNINDHHHSSVIGSDWILTDYDQIFIVDDNGGDNSILVNGGHTIYIRPNDIAYLLGHYSDLVNLLFSCHQNESPQNKHIKNYLKGFSLKP